MATLTNQHPLAHLIELRVDVHFGGELLPGKITQVHQRPEGRDIKVIFDDPLVYGGTGAGWFTPDQVSLPGQAAPIG